MATKRDFRSSTKRDLRSGPGGRPGRPLLLILVAMVALTGGMFVSGHTTPRLGIDLAGGTSITLEAVPEEGHEDAINSTNLNTAVSIIERRVNGLGVSEAEVQTQGDRNIVVNIPKGTDEQEAREQVGTTAQLGFRPVLSSAAATPAPQDQSGGSGDSGDSGNSGNSDNSGDSSGSGGSGSGNEQNSDSGSGSGSGEDTGSGDQSGDGSDSQSMPAPGGTTNATTASYTTQDGGDTGSDQGSGEGSQQEQANDIATQLQQLDCSTEKARLKASQAAAQAPDDAQVVTCDSEGVEKLALGPIAIPGTDVSGADAVFDSQTGKGWIVQMEFNNSGADKFADTTEQLAGKAEPMNRFAIVLDGEVVSAPSVSERLGGGRAEISGSFNQDSAQELANILKYGALPLNFEEASVSTVSPALGGEQLRAGLIAGAIGLALVVLYLVLYYRGLSLIAFSSLVVSAILTYTIMSLLGPAIGFALNLPAVCGAIVAIGITADSFIVYFERIRDEIREGRTLRPAVERAWPRARRTILVSDFVSFLAAAVLFVVTVGKVQGFAFTLGLTTLLDVVVVFLFTKPLMTLLARRRFFSNGHAWSGLDPKRLGARSRRGGRRSATVPSDVKEA